jgi:uncharacterized protein YceK
MIRKILIIATVLPTLLFSTGCASVAIHNEKKREPNPVSHGRYPRSQYDLEIMGAAFSDDSDVQAWGFAFFPFFLIDLPISAVVDTAFLPWEWNSVSKQETKDNHNHH